MKIDYRHRGAGLSGQIGLPWRAGLEHGGARARAPPPRVIDTGNMSMRTMLIKRFAGRGVKPADITDLLLTHSHHDHSTMFPKARIVIGADELAWSLTVPWGETPVPELYMRELNIWPTLHRAADGEEVFPGITAHLAPGHTPGHLVFVMHAAERDVTCGVVRC
jgi:N-acyl homoserine lactone hydrolase